MGREDAGREVRGGVRGSVFVGRDAKGKAISVNGGDGLTIAIEREGEGEARLRAPRGRGCGLAVAREDSGRARQIETGAETQGSWPRDAVRPPSRTEASHGFPFRSLVTFEVGSPYEEHR
jgi:hypothetical protein